MDYLTISYLAVTGCFVVHSWPLYIKKLDDLCDASELSDGAVAIGAILLFCVLAISCAAWPIIMVVVHALAIKRRFAK